MFLCHALSCCFSVFLCPYPVPTRLVPFVLFFAHQLWFGFSWSALIGLVVGHVISLLPFLILPAPLLRALEFPVLSRREGFVPASKAGTMQPWSHYVHEENPNPAVAPSVGAAHASNNAGPPSFTPRSRVAAGSRAADAGTWRRVDASSSSSSASQQAASSSSSSGSSSSDDEVSASASINSAHASAVRSSLPPAAARPHSPTMQRSAVLAANVARILEPSYPTNAPSGAEIQQTRAQDEALQHDVAQ